MYLRANHIFLDKNLSPKSLHDFLRFTLHSPPPPWLPAQTSTRNIDVSVRALTITESQRQDVAVWRAQILHKLMTGQVEKYTDGVPTEHKQKMQDIRCFGPDGWVVAFVAAASGSSRPPHRQLFLLLHCQYCPFLLQRPNPLIFCLYLLFHLRYYLTYL